MTCIAAIAQDGIVYMAGDSAASEPNAGGITTVTSPKIFIKDEYLIGYAGSFRMGKFIQYTVEFPKLPSWAKGGAKLDEFMNGTVSPSIRKQVREHELEQSEKEGFGLVIGIRGSIFEVDEEWAAYENIRNYTAIGSGGDIAIGSLYSTNKWGNAKKRLQTAMEASALYNSYVSAPFTLLEI